jgi:hypothetical protein
MKLTGSRSREDHDAFSDWDYRLESTDDFAAVQKHLATCLLWKPAVLPVLRGVTLIDTNGDLYDYASPHEMCESQWDSIAAQEDHSKIRDYWIMTFKHLKALYRNLDPLCSIGLEISTACARDIFFQYALDVNFVGSFYEFKKIATTPRLGDIELITGLPYRTRQEKLDKICALNRVVVDALPGFSDRTSAVFEERLHLLR